MHAVQEFQFRYTCILWPLAGTINTTAATLIIETHSSMSNNALRGLCLGVRDVNSLGKHNRLEIVRSVPLPSSSDAADKVRSLVAHFSVFTLKLFLSRRSVVYLHGRDELLVSKDETVSTRVKHH